MAAPTQLSLYNGALLLLGEGTLASTSEDREPRRVLDSVWERRAIDNCLEQGIWNFAMRSVMAQADPDIEAEFGFQNAFLKPSDWIKTSVIAADEYFTVPLTTRDFRDEAGYWWSNLETIYIRFVSNNSSYGTNYSLWPATFERFVESYLAKMAGPRIKGVSAEKVKLAEAIYDKLKADAESSDSSNDGSSIQPDGSWARARRTSNRRDLGNRNSLIG